MVCKVNHTLIYQTILNKIGLTLMLWIYLSDAVALRTNVTEKGDQEILQVVMKKKISSSFLYVLMSPCVNKSHHFSVSSDRLRLIGLFCSNFHLWKNGIQEQGQQNLQRTRTSVLI